uniref:Uncharacterized protein n=1 Tax=Rhizophora mucronata TaxID=61149 RepID=A0A2P2PZB8_RHIMU
MCVLFSSSGGFEPLVYNWLMSLTLLWIFWSNFGRRKNAWVFMHY